MKISLSDKDHFILSSFKNQAVLHHKDSRANQSTSQQVLFLILKSTIFLLCNWFPPCQNSAYYCLLTDTDTVNPGPETLNS